MTQKHQSLYVTRWHECYNPVALSRYEAVLTLEIWNRSLRRAQPPLLKMETRIFKGNTYLSTELNSISFTIRVGNIRYSTLRNIHLCIWLDYVTLNYRISLSDWIMQQLFPPERTIKKKLLKYSFSQNFRFHYIWPTADKLLLFEGSMS